VRTGTPHPEKTKIVYCKDDFRHWTYPNEKFDFLGYRFQPRRSKNRWGKFFINFSPAVSNKAAKAMPDTIPSWNLPRRSDKVIEQVTQVQPASPRLAPVVRAILSLRTLSESDDARTGPRSGPLAKRKYQKLRQQLRRATHWIAPISRRDPELFAHWQMGVRRGSMLGAV
jgi:RNA-directed DNA polymerase